MTTVPSRKHQEPGGKVPVGPAVSAERQKAHEEVLRGDAGFRNMVLKLDQVRRALKKGSTSSDYLDGAYTFVSTSTMQDAKTKDLGWREEADLVRKFRPAFHIPTDYPVYESDSVAVREENIRRLLDGTDWMIQELADTRTRVLPLLKGVTPGEREVFYRMFRERGFETCAFYGTQYFTQGPGLQALNRDLHRVQAEAPELRVFLIGLLSPKYLNRVPSNVVGAAGQAKWRRRTGLRDADVGLGEMRSRSRVLMREASEVLGRGQAPLSRWVEQLSAEAPN